MLHHPFKKGVHTLSALYALNFLRGVITALLIFFNANFLISRGISGSWLGILFIIGSALSIAAYYVLPTILTKYGAYKTLLLTAIMQMAVYIGLGTLLHTPSLLVLFIISLVLYVPLIYGLDVLLEGEVHDEGNTGDVRSIFLSLSSFAFVISPFFAGIILKHFGFSQLYYVAALTLIPFIIILTRNFYNLKDTSYKMMSLAHIATVIRNDADVRNIFIVQFLLNFFYAWMTIYIPIYLHVHIGFSLSAIGILFSVMLIPFVLLEYPLGHYADKRYGEKEFLIAGFIIIALATYSLSFITTADFAMWMLMLFITRIGAAIIEVMNEIYFFKHVDATDTDTISTFRMLNPLAYIVAPAIGSLLLLTLPMQYISGILGIIMLIGILASLKLKDTQ